MQAKFNFILLLIFLAGASVKAQTERDTTLIIGKDTTKTKAKAKDGPIKDAARLELEAKPRRAAIQSAMLPGLGQFKNRGFAWYVKIPLIYGGLIMLGDQFIANRNRYKFLLGQAILKQDNTAESLAAMDPSYRDIELSRLVEAKDVSRRNRDLCILGGLAVYGINIVDAYVTGKFLRYDITSDLALKVSPSLQNQSFGLNTFSLPAPALKISLSLKK